MSPPYTVLRPANRYASRLPNVRNGLVYKLATPRLAPARFGEYVLDLDPLGTVDAPAGLEDWRRDLLTDPQTSGGLLIAVAPDKAQAALDLVRLHGFDEAAVVGRFAPGPGRVRLVASAALQS